MSAFIKSVLLVISGAVCLLCQSIVAEVKQTMYELEISFSWLELLKASAFFMSGLFISGLIMSVF